MYDIAVASLALGVERKWLDNLLSQHDIPGVEHVARGVTRKLSTRALVTAAAVRDLQRRLGVPAGRAVELAAHVVAASHHRVELSPALTIHLDLTTLERDLERRLVHAMETAVPRRRGRPAADRHQRRRGTP
ncbi:MAG: hypothetical protein HOQ09_01855 [Gemmatimonadaceae bacterium]|nr:hypothetical protein [Gemmatimonadaceae bacterium]